MKIAALGRTEYLYKSILELKKRGFEVVLIITCQEAPEYKKGVEDFRSLAKKIGADFLNTEKINNQKVKQLIKKDQPQIAISVNWRTLVSEEIIKSFPLGIINAHCGALPRYRGNAVPNWAIIRGEKEIVVTLHLMQKELDAGPILLKKKMFLTDQTYIGDIYKFIFDNLPDMFNQAIKGLAGGKIKPQKQSKNPKLSLRCYPRVPKDSEINWQKSAIEISRLVRASAEPLFGAYTFLDGRKLKIWRAYPEKSNFPYLGIHGQVAERRKKEGEVAIITGNGFLVIEKAEIENQGKKEATDIIKSNRDRLGFDIMTAIEKLEQKIKNFIKKKELKL